MTHSLATNAIVIERPGSIVRRELRCAAPTAADLIVDVEVSGVSTGTEKLLWQGTMPAFPGLGYPLVPGYESVGRVIGAGEDCHLQAGDRVFVPGTTCYEGEVRGLFGATASRLVVPEARVASVGDLPAEHAALLALAATAMHALTYRRRHQLREAAAGMPGAPRAAVRGTPDTTTVDLADIVAHAPELVIGHGVLGRLIARLCIAIGAPAPVVWEIAEARRAGAIGYPVIDPADDDRHDYARICDVSGAGGTLIDSLLGRLTRGGHLTLAGFYTDAVSFAFPAAFMREARIGIAAEWSPDDLALVQALTSAGTLRFDDLVTHTVASDDAEAAYPEAFTNPDCLKMILHWSQT